MDRMNDGKPTTENLYAWISVMPGEAVEGVVCALTADGTMPLMTTDREVAEWMKPIAAQICRTAGTVGALVRFNRDITLDTTDGFHPERT